KVVLDADTAHCDLVLSDDRKSVKREDTRQDIPDIPERFNQWCCVLGCEGFTSGRYYWETPKRIRVSLDYEEGRVAFFSVDEEIPIFT
ncbi:PREDICTED: butyrophilin subfamily 1 member A1-like, partial [Tauraco erythrolophus]|uniref:butyrophilin subfamily 1 member A1-like n=1 Tax=Tauraco erythrolophus TaxID=121530 RepID=UPI0005236BAE